MRRLKSSLALSELRDIRKMTLLQQAKTLGGVGSLLIVLFVVPTVGWLLALVGLILILVAVRYLSIELGDRTIFNNMMISVGAAIAGVVIAGVYIASAVLAYFGIHGGFDFMPTPGTIPTDMIALVLSVVAGLVIVWLALVVSAFFLRRSFGVIGARLKVGYFKTSALLYLIGAATAIVLIGFVILFVAEIMQLVAFFSIPDQLAPSGTPPTTA